MYIDNDMYAPWARLTSSRSIEKTKLMSQGSGRRQRGHLRARDITIEDMNKVQWTQLDISSEFVTGAMVVFVMYTDGVIDGSKKGRKNKIKTEGREEETNRQQRQDRVNFKQ